MTNKNRKIELAELGLGILDGTVYLLRTCVIGVLLLILYIYWPDITGTDDDVVKPSPEVMMWQIEQQKQSAEPEHSPSHFIYDPDWHLTFEEQWDWYRYFVVTEECMKVDRLKDPIGLLADELEMERNDANDYLYQIFRLADGHHERLSPELFRDNILNLIFCYDPETMSGTTYPAMQGCYIQNFCNEYCLRLEYPGYINQMMADAIALLSEEDQARLPECAPDIIAAIDEIFATPPEERSIFDEFTDYNTKAILKDAFTYYKADESWTRARTALLAAMENSIS